jgi:hypothetical protein
LLEGEVPSSTRKNKIEASFTTTQRKKLLHNNNNNKARL